MDYGKLRELSMLTAAYENGEVTTKYFEARRGELAKAAREPELFRALESYVKAAFDAAVARTAALDDALDLRLRTLEGRIAELERQAAEAKAAPDSGSRWLKAV